MEDRLRAPTQATEGQQTSTLAQELAAEMDSMFGPDVITLEVAVDQKKSSVTSAEQELEELERRLRETERRLQKVSRTTSPDPKRELQIHQQHHHHQQPDTMAGAGPQQEQQQQQQQHRQYVAGTGQTAQE